MNLGAVLSNSEINTKAVRSGTITLLITDLTKDVIFTSAMPSANYRVFAQVEGNLAVVLWPTSKLTTGFTLNMSVGVAGSVSYMVIED